MTKKTGANIQFDSLLEKDRGNQLKEIGKYLLFLLLHHSEEACYTVRYGNSPV